MSSQSNTQQQKKKIVIAMPQKISGRGILKKAAKFSLLNPKNLSVVFMVTSFVSRFYIQYIQTIQM